MHEGEPSARQVAHDGHLTPIAIRFTSFGISWTCCHSNQDSCQSFYFPSSFIHLYVHLEGGGEGRNGTLSGKGLWILGCPPNRTLGIISSCGNSMNQKWSPAEIVVSPFHVWGGLRYFCEQSGVFMILELEEIAGNPLLCAV